jgi:GDP-L-fucose synthase
MLPLQDSRIVVTGGAGFLGRHVVEAFAAHRPGLVAVPRSRDYDLRDPAAVARLYADARPDVVVHLAAVVGGIGANRENPGRFFYENALMGLHLIHEALAAGVRKVVLLGSICSYPKYTPVPFRECELWNGYPEETNAPYGLAKRMLLVQAQAYREQYGLNAITLMPVNLYGPHDNFDLESSHVIPALIRKAIEARESRSPQMVVWGTGGVSREFLYVRDAADAIVTAARCYDGAEPVNLGTGREILIRDLAEIIRRECRYEGEIVWDASKPDGQPRRCLDVTRARELFGFEAKTTFERGLRETIRWYEQERLRSCRRAA